LEREIAGICRKAIVWITENEADNVTVTPELVREYLKKQRYESGVSEVFKMPGIATGLAVTSVGGDILFIEASKMPGKGRLTLTGQLGDVMRESAEIAFSYVRAKAETLGIDPAEWGKSDLHLHVPAGALPKDGPSAGVAMVMALASLYSGAPLRSDVGITGEMTLRGRALPVGGIKMKVLAAHRAGLKQVVLPEKNVRDLDDLPPEVRQSIDFVSVDQVDEALIASLMIRENQDGSETAGASGQEVGQVTTGADC
jgi:ATP-dependent Lon protease